MAVIFLFSGKFEGDLIGLVIAFFVGEGLTGDDEWGTGLVDEDVVDLVDDRVMKAEFVGAGIALHAHDLLAVGRVAVVAPAGLLHVVAEVIEAEFTRSAIGDVAVVGTAAAIWVHIGLDEGRFHSESSENGEHPFAVAA